MPLKYKWLNYWTVNTRYHSCSLSMFLLLNFCCVVFAICVSCYLFIIYPSPNPCSCFYLYFILTSFHFIQFLFHCSVLSDVPGCCSTHRSAGSVQWSPSLLACIPWSSYTPPGLDTWCSPFCSCRTPQTPHGALIETHGGTYVNI